MDLHGNPYGKQYLYFFTYVSMQIHMRNHIFFFQIHIIYIYMDYHIFYSFFHLISYGKRHIIYPIHIFFVNIVFYFYKSTWKTTSTHFTHSNIFIAVSIIILYNSTLITIYTIFILPYYVFITI